MSQSCLSKYVDQIYVDALHDIRLKWPKATLDPFIFIHAAAISHDGISHDGISHDGMWTNVATCRLR